MRRWRRWPVAVMLAGACAAVLHTRVYTEFALVRFRVVTSPRAASAGAVVAALPDLARLAGQPAALVLRLANGGAAPRTVRVAAGDAVLGEAVVRPGREAQMDLSVSDGVVLTDAGRLDLTADGGGWALTYLEAANVHGFSTGAFEVMVTPAPSRTPQRLGTPAGVAAFGLLLTLHILGWRRIAYRRGRAAHAAAAALVVSFLAAVLAAPFVSGFAVHLATHTFVVCVAVLYYPALATLAPIASRALLRFGRALSHGLQAAGVPVARIAMHVSPRLSAVRNCLMRAVVSAWAKPIPWVYAAAIVFFVTSVAKWCDPVTGLTPLIRFGERFEHRLLPAVRALPRHVYEGDGYDGQFYAQLSVDPLLRDPEIGRALDAPLYRARRILFSWTAYLAGLGRTDWVVQAYAAQYVVVWLLLAWVLCRWFPPTSLRNLGLWFGCLFSEGLVVSVLRTVPDGPGMLLLAVGAAAMERGRTNRAALVVGIACLAKSTNALWSAMVLRADDVRHRDWRNLLLRGFLVAGPGAAWALYLLLGSHELGGLGGLGGGLTELVGGGSVSGNFGLPFSGYASKWAATVAELRAAGGGGVARFSLFALIGLTTQAVVLLAARDWRNPWWRAGIGSVVLMAFLGPAVWEGYPVAVTRVLLPMVFAFNAVLPRTAWFWPLFVLGNLSVLQSLEYLRVPYMGY